MNENGKPVSDYEVDLLMSYFDKDLDGSIGWHDFIMSMVKVDALTTPLYSEDSLQKDKFYDYRVSTKVEHSLVRVIEKEIQNLKRIENYKRVFMNSTALNEKLLFEEIDKSHKGFITQQDLYDYAMQFVSIENFNPKTVYRVFKRIDWDMDGVLNYSEFLQSIRPTCSWAYLPNTTFSGNFKDEKHLTQGSYYQSPKRELKTERSYYYDLEKKGDRDEYASIVKTERYDSLSRREYMKPKRICQSNHKAREKGEWDRLGEEKDLFGTPKKRPKTTRRKRKNYEPQNASSKAAPKNKFNWECTLRQSNQKNIPPVETTSTAKRPKKPKVDSKIFPEQNRASMREKSPYKRFSKKKKTVKKPTSADKQTWKTYQMKDETVVLTQNNENIRNNKIGLNNIHEISLAQEESNTVQENTMQENINNQNETDDNNEYVIQTDRYTFEADKMDTSTAGEEYAYHIPFPRHESPYKKREQYSPPPKLGSIDKALSSKFREFMKQCVSSNKIIEEKRIALSLRFDFNLRELYRMADKKNTGTIMQSEFNKFISMTSTKINKLERVMILDKYSTKNDSNLDFYDFCSIFAPYNDAYRKALFERGRRGVMEYKNYTRQTQRLIKDLLKSLAISLMNFELNKDRITNGDIVTSNELFDFLDLHKNGAVSFKEFENQLYKIHPKATKADIE